MEENGSIVVLSLFDGMSCGQTALKELGIIPEIYYASEIDKHAIGETQLNFPNTIQLGSVTTVYVANLKHIDLLIGGSPCQSFSFAGKRKGMSTKSDVEIYTLEKYLELKEQGFEFEGQSYLFWEYMRILTDIRKYNPDVKFLLENVEMGNKWERVLSEAIGIYGVHINSALVSAQNRKRIYWTNIRTKQVGLFGELHADIPQPKDEGILLRDILERDVAEKYYLSDKVINNLEIHKQRNKEKGNGFGAVYHKENIKMGAVKIGGSGIDDLVCVAMRGRNPDNPSDRRTGSPTEQRLEPNLSGKTNCLTSVQKDNLVLQLKSINNRVEGVSFNEEGVRPYQNDSRKSGIQELGTIAMENTKTSCLTTNHAPKCIVSKDNLVVCLTPKRTDYGKQIRKQYEAGEVSAMRKEVSQLEPREDGKTNTITTVQKDNLVIQLNPSKESGGVQPYQQNRVYDPNGISPCLNTDSRPPAIVEINERQQRNLKDVNEKADTFLSTSWKGSQANGMTLVYTPCDYRHDEGVRMKQDGKTDASTGSATDDESCGQLVHIEQRERGFNKGGKFEDKTPTVSSNSWEQNSILHAESRIRRLTPTEVARLQTVPDWYKWEMVGQFDKIYYLCDELKYSKSWNRKNVKIKDAQIQLQLNKLNYAPNATSKDNVKVHWKFQDQLLINQSSAMCLDAKETNKQKMVYVSCTTSGLLEMDQQNYLLLISKEIKNVSIAINRQGLVDQEECVQDITKCINYTETHCMLKLKEAFPVQGDIYEIQTEFAFTLESWKSISEDFLQKEKLYTILTPLKQITKSVICTYAKVNPNMRLSMRNLELSQEMELTSHVYLLQTENTYTSDSAIYKLCGNGWTIKVIMHIFSFLKF